MRYTCTPNNGRPQDVQTFDADSPKEAMLAWCTWKERQLGMKPCQILAGTNPAHNVWNIHAPKTPMYTLTVLLVDDGGDDVVLIPDTPQAAPQALELDLLITVHMPTSEQGAETINRIMGDHGFKPDGWVAAHEVQWRRPITGPYKLAANMPRITAVELAPRR